MVERKSVERKNCWNKKGVFTNESNPVLTKKDNWKKEGLKDKRKTSWRKEYCGMQVILCESKGRQ
jgi:hypothetical protein